MGKVKELAQEIRELRKCGELIIDIAEELERKFTSAAEAGEAAEDPGADVRNLEATWHAGAAAVPGPDGNTGNGAAAAPAEPEIANLTLIDVRKVLAEKSRKGFTDSVKAIIKKHGADKLSEMDPSEYPAVLIEAEALGDG